MTSDQPLPSAAPESAVGEQGASLPSLDWQPIETAPRDGTGIMGRRTYADRYTGKLKYEKRRTFWGKTSHVPLYGWNWGRDVEDLNLWQPTHWKPLANGT